MDEAIEGIKYKLQTEKAWATSEQLQDVADKLNITVGEVIEKLQTMFNLVGDKCKN